jgi:uncharacterized protein YecA (UPF0149 family)
MQVDGQPNVAITYAPLDLLNFIKRDFMPMNAMCERAEMLERGIYDRSKAVFEYFGLPFDAEPPAPAISTLRHPVPGQPKIGRNEPCPCGSGKKYKRCCGKG